MTDEQLPAIISGYSAGLEAEIGLLRQLERLARRHREAILDKNLPEMATLGDERERVIAALVEIEHQIKPQRTELASALDRVSALPGFVDLVELHKTARHLVATILSSDEESVRGLREAESARRLVAQAVEQGEMTLAAYRRVVAPNISSAALVDRRG